MRMCRRMHAWTGVCMYWLRPLTEQKHHRHHVQSGDASQPSLQANARLPLYPSMPSHDVVQRRPAVCATRQDRTQQLSTAQQASCRPRFLFPPFSSSPSCPLLDGPSASLTALVSAGLSFHPASRHACVVDLEMDSSRACRRLIHHQLTLKGAFPAMERQLVLSLDLSS
ncbi:hypothetical protein CDD80_238 [Ophiocordyceps camponoti-rufipedis]|uniref:Uncharacterized protein n=1 Tax=Ophiocordyceps camponoti-rufipedis TaxID=2004952 RepID=A0A2C5ZD99_9HYPO|nr:hypothetical protein CDD80_238 [Ophiocordyceps camponoti-rufipedis]